MLWSGSGLLLRGGGDDIAPRSWSKRNRGPCRGDGRTNFWAAPCFLPLLTSPTAPSQILSEISFSFLWSQEMVYVPDEAILWRFGIFFFLCWESSWTLTSWATCGVSVMQQCSCAHWILMKGKSLASFGRFVPLNASWRDMGGCSMSVSTACGPVQRVCLSLFGCIYFRYGSGLKCCNVPHVVQSFLSVRPSSTSKRSPGSQVVPLVLLQFIHEVKTEAAHKLVCVFHQCYIVLVFCLPFFFLRK